MSRTSIGDSRLPPSFWSRVTEQPDGCWTWSGYLLNGYGRYGNWRSGRSQQAHRRAYSALVAEVPADLAIDHKCRVRNCVNPAHLEPVTHVENIRRGLRGEMAPLCDHGRTFGKCSKCAGRRNRQRRIDAGLCVDSPSHGPATVGQKCEACATRSRTISKERMRATRAVKKLAGGSL